MQIRSYCGASGHCIPFRYLGTPGAFENVLSNIQTRFCKHLDLDTGIAMNAALSENLFVAIVCILNKLPVFLVGKPGTSKTLTLQIIAKNLQGAQSPAAFWRKFPAVRLFQYQCSPMSKTRDLLVQFDRAVAYQRQSGR